MTDKDYRTLINFQRRETTMAVLYKELAIRMKDQSNKEILLKLASDELDHYHTIKRITTRNIKPDRLRINLFFLICNIFGLTFGIKLMEYNKKRDRRLYASLNRYPQIKVIIEEGEINEKILIGKIEEQRLMYMSAVVLGLNDAIIEFTGALAGFAFAFQNSKYVAMAGAITGIAAALSMGASEYLSSKSDKNITTKSALISASYTLVTYFVTVIALLSPFVYLSNVYWGISI